MRLEMTEAVGTCSTVVEVEVASEADERAWDEYVAQHADATSYHRWCWRRVFERAFGHEAIYLAARRGGRVVGVLPIVSFRSWLFGKFLVSLPFVNYGGVLADDGSAAGALVEGARLEASWRNAAHVELRHTGRLCPDLPVKQHKVAMRLTLPSDQDAAWKGLDSKVRNQVRKAQKSNFDVVVGGAELLEDFYRVFSRNMRDLGTPVYSRRFFAQMLAAVPMTRVYSVRREGLPVAAGITIGYRDVIENPWASSLREYRGLNPNMLLYWAMLCDAIARGYRVFDFGRSTPQAGTWHFKKQWGACESPCYWEYALNDGHTVPHQGPENPKFSAAIAVWQHLPLAVTNRVGPVIVRNIP